MAQFLGIIPARYASSRFPGKPLALLDNRPMIQWVYERASAMMDHLVVATDDLRIKEAVENFGGRVLMTSPDHGSGTERCFEAFIKYKEQYGGEFSYVINIQGDEPLIHKEQLGTLMECVSREGVQIGTLIKPFSNREELENPNTVKTVVDKEFRAMYFSRSPIPFIRSQDKKEHEVTYYDHIGLYAFRSDVLEKVVGMQTTPLERAESLEQLRWLEHGLPIHTMVTNQPSQSVDTPEDLEKIKSRL